MRIIKSTKDLFTKATDGLHPLLQKYLKRYLHELFESLGDGVDEQEFILREGECVAILESVDANHVGEALSQLGLKEYRDDPISAMPEYIMKKILIDNVTNEKLPIYSFLFLMDNETAISLFSLVGSLDDDMETFLAESASDLPFVMVTL